MNRFASTLFALLLLGCAVRHARPELIPCNPMTVEGRKCPPGLRCSTSYDFLDDPNGPPSGSYCRPVERHVSAPQPPLDCRSELVDGGWVHEPLRDGGCFGTDD